MSETRVGRAISKSKPSFTLLIVDSNTIEGMKPMRPLAQSLLREFEDVFPNDLLPGLLALRGIEHQINLLQSAPLPNKLAYRCNPNGSKELQQQVQDMRDRGYIRESLSLCIVLALLVPGTSHMYVDSKAINDITVKYQFPILRLDDMLDESHRSRVFFEVAITKLE